MHQPASTDDLPPLRSPSASRRGRRRSARTAPGLVLVAATPVAVLGGCSALGTPTATDVSAPSAVSSSQSSDGEHAASAAYLAVIAQ